MNKEALLKLTDEELPQALDGILSGPFEHEVVNHGTHHVKCKRCNEVILLMERWDIREHHPCWVSPFDDLIPIDDFNTAMRWRDWAVEEVGQLAYSKAITKVYWDVEYIGSDIAVNGYKWVIAKAKAKHYLLAAAICKLEGNNNG
jgi:hypothetical protein